MRKHLPAAIKTAKIDATAGDRRRELGAAYHVFVPCGRWLTVCLLQCPERPVGLRTLTSIGGRDRCARRPEMSR